MIDISGRHFVGGQIMRENEASVLTETLRFWIADAGEEGNDEGDQKGGAVESGQPPLVLAATTSNGVAHHLRFGFSYSLSLSLLASFQRSELVS